MTLVASQKQSSDAHKTPYHRVKRCREHKINIKASERVNCTVDTNDVLIEGAVEVRSLASHLGEAGSIPGGITPGFSHVGIVPDDVAGPQVFSWMSRCSRPFIRGSFLNIAAYVRRLRVSTKGKLSKSAAMNELVLSRIAGSTTYGTPRRISLTPHIKKITRQTRTEMFVRQLGSRGTAAVYIGRLLPRGRTAGTFDFPRLSSCRSGEPRRMHGAEGGRKYPAAASGVPRGPRHIDEPCDLPTSSRYPTSEAEKRCSDKDDSSARIKRAIAATRMALNWRAVLSSCRLLIVFKAITPISGMIMGSLAQYDGMSIVDGWWGKSGNGGGDGDCRSPSKPANQRYSPGTIPNCENPGVTQLEIEPDKSTHYYFLKKTNDTRYYRAGTTKGIIDCYIGIKEALTSVSRNEQKYFVINEANKRLANRVRFLAGSLPDFSHVEIVPDDADGRPRFLGDLPFPLPLHSGAAPYSPFFTLIGSQCLDVKSRPNLLAHFRLDGLHGQISFETREGGRKNLLEGRMRNWAFSFPGPSRHLKHKEEEKRRR
ncbi:hypothetical protein PR048_025012 [Dryococelus australis]|uniref:Uncharacterized protein n=1 Tax=Dryococelus australis TaxID=614101 RepID=A0ABQ9GQ63_9NEOP|nr:hypothetical protein PR048_025012 [Dryococelus australis]